MHLAALYLRDVLLLTIMGYGPGKFFKFREFVASESARRGSLSFQTAPEAVPDTLLFGLECGDICSKTRQAK